MEVQEKISCLKILLKILLFLLSSNKCYSEVKMKNSIHVTQFCKDKAILLIQNKLGAMSHFDNFEKGIL